MWSHPYCLPTLKSSPISARTATRRKFSTTQTTVGNSPRLHRNLCCSLVDLAAPLALSHCSSFPQAEVVVFSPLCSHHTCFSPLPSFKIARKMSYLIPSLFCSTCCITASFRFARFLLSFHLCLAQLDTPVPLFCFFLLSHFSKRSCMHFSVTVGGAALTGAGSTLATALSLAQLKHFDVLTDMSAPAALFQEFNQHVHL